MGSFSHFTIHLESVPLSQGRMITICKANRAWPIRYIPISQAKLVRMLENRAISVVLCFLVSTFCTGKLLPCQRKETSGKHKKCSQSTATEIAIEMGMEMEIETLSKRKGEPPTERKPHKSMQARAKVVERAPSQGSLQIYCLSSWFLLTFFA